MEQDDLENFIDGMKARESDELRLMEEHRTRAIAIQTERMKLESWMHKVKQRDAASVLNGNEVR
jgi:hypothetical protein